MEILLHTRTAHRIGVERILVVGEVRCIRLGRKRLDILLISLLRSFFVRSPAVLGTQVLAVRERVEVSLDTGVCQRGGQRAVIRDVSARLVAAGERVNALQIRLVNHVDALKALEMLVSLQEALQLLSGIGGRTVQASIVHIHADAVILRPGHHLMPCGRIRARVGIRILRVHDLGDTQVGNRLVDILVHQGVGVRAVETADRHHGAFFLHLAEDAVAQGDHVGVGDVVIVVHIRRLVKQSVTRATVQSDHRLDHVKHVHFLIAVGVAGHIRNHRLGVDERAVVPLDLVHAGVRDGLLGAGLVNVHKVVLGQIVIQIVVQFAREGTGLIVVVLKVGGAENNALTHLIAEVVQNQRRIVVQLTVDVEIHQHIVRVAVHHEIDAEFQFLIQEGGQAEIRRTHRQAARIAPFARAGIHKGDLVAENIHAQAVPGAGTGDTAVADVELAATGVMEGEVAAERSVQQRVATKQRGLKRVDTVNLRILGVLRNVGERTEVGVGQANKRSPDTGVNRDGIGRTRTIVGQADTEVVVGHILVLNGDILVLVQNIVKPHTDQHIIGIVLIFKRKLEIVDAADNIDTGLLVLKSEFGQHFAAAGSQISQSVTGRFELQTVPSAQVHQLVASADKQPVDTVKLNVVEGNDRFVQRRNLVGSRLEGQTNTAMVKSIGNTEVVRSQNGPAVFHGRQLLIDDFGVQGNRTGFVTGVAVTHRHLIEGKAFLALGQVCKEVTVFVQNTIEPHTDLHRGLGVIGVFHGDLQLVAAVRCKADTRRIRRKGHSRQHLTVSRLERKEIAVTRQYLKAGPTVATADRPIQISGKADGIKLQDHLIPCRGLIGGAVAAVTVGRSTVSAVIKAEIVRGQNGPALFHGREVFGHTIVRGHGGGMSGIFDRRVRTMLNDRVATHIGTLHVIHTEQFIVDPHREACIFILILHVPHLDGEDKLSIRHRTGDAELCGGIALLAGNHLKGTLTTVNIQCQAGAGLINVEAPLPTAGTVVHVRVVSKLHLTDKFVIRRSGAEMTGEPIATVSGRRGHAEIRPGDGAQRFRNFNRGGLGANLERAVHQRDRIAYRSTVVGNRKVVDTEQGIVDPNRHASGLTGNVPHLEAHVNALIGHVTADTQFSRGEGILQFGAVRHREGTDRAAEFQGAVVLQFQEETVARVRTAVMDLGIRRHLHQTGEFQTGERIVIGCPTVNGIRAACGIVRSVVNGSAAVSKVSPSDRAGRIRDGAFDTGNDTAGGINDKAGSISGSTGTLHRQEIRIDGSRINGVGQHHAGYELIVNPQAHHSRRAVVLGQRGLKVQTDVLKGGQTEISRIKGLHRRAPAGANLQGRAVRVDVHTVPTGGCKQIDLRIVGRREVNITVKQKIIGLGTLIVHRTAGEGKFRTVRDARTAERIVVPRNNLQIARNRSVGGKGRGLGGIVDSGNRTVLNDRNRAVVVANLQCALRIVHAEQHIVEPHRDTSVFVVVRHVPHLDGEGEFGIRHRAGHAEFRSGIGLRTRNDRQGAVIGADGQAGAGLLHVETPLQAGRTVVDDGVIGQFHLTDKLVAVRNGAETGAVKQPAVSAKSRGRGQAEIRPGQFGGRRGDGRCRNGLGGGASRHRAGHAFHRLTKTVRIAIGMTHRGAEDVLIVDPHVPIGGFAVSGHIGHGNLEVELRTDKAGQANRRRINRLLLSKGARVTTVGENQVAALVDGNVGRQPGIGLRTEEAPLGSRREDNVHVEDGVVHRSGDTVALATGKRIADVDAESRPVDFTQTGGNRDVIRDAPVFITRIGKGNRHFQRKALAGIRGMEAAFHHNFVTDSSRAETGDIKTEIGSCCGIEQAVTALYIKAIAVKEGSGFVVGRKEVVTLRRVPVDIAIRSDFGQIRFLQDFGIKARCTLRPIRSHTHTGQEFRRIVNFAAQVPLIIGIKQHQVLLQLDTNVRVAADVGAGRHRDGVAFLRLVIRRITVAGVNVSRHLGVSVTLEGGIQFVGRVVKITQHLAVLVLENHRDGILGVIIARFGKNVIHVHTNHPTAVLLPIDHLSRANGGERRRRGGDGEGEDRAEQQGHHTKQRNRNLHEILFH